MLPRNDPCCPRCWAERTLRICDTPGQWQAKRLCYACAEQLEELYRAHKLQLLADRRATLTPAQRLAQADADADDLYGARR